MIDPTKICVIAIENKLKNKTLTKQNFLAFKELFQFIRIHNNP